MTYLDWSKHATQTKFSIEVNEGYSACLHNIKRERNPYFPHDSAIGQAWFRGWDMAALSLKGKR